MRYDIYQNVIGSVFIDTKCILTQEPFLERNPSYAGANWDSEPCPESARRMAPSAIAIRVPE